MEATHPATPIRRTRDYTPGPPILTPTAWRIRSAPDAEHLLARLGGHTEPCPFCWAYQDHHPDGQPTRPPLLPGCAATYLSAAAVDAAAADTVAGLPALAAALADLLMPAAGTELDAARYARLFAFRATAHLAGIPTSPRAETVLSGMFDRLTQWTGTGDLPSPDPAEEAFLTGLLAHPAPGLLTALTAARTGGTITHDEAISLLRGFLYAGTDTAGAAATTLIGFLAGTSNRYWQDQARTAGGPARDQLLRGYAAETARLWPNPAELHRWTTRPIGLPSGITIPQGREVALVLPAINRDARRAGPDPDEFRPARAPATHNCPGRYTAHAIAAAATSAALDATTELALPADGWLAAGGLITYTRRAACNGTGPCGRRGTGSASR